MNDEDGAAAPSAFSRRSFLKRMAAIAFAAPVVASFTLDAGRSHAAAQETASYLGNQYFGYGNQWLTTPNEFFVYANQPFPNEYFPNQAAAAGFANQYYPNQL